MVPIRSRGRVKPVAERREDGASHGMDKDDGR